MHDHHGHGHDHDVEGWIGDFLESTQFRAVEPAVRPRAGEFLDAFMRAATGLRGACPDDIEERDVSAGLLEGAARLEATAEERAAVPGLVAAFLEQLESVGRLSGGRVLGLHAKAVREAYEDAATGKQRPFVLPNEKVGRNDPCPCGSGKKFKKCCQGLLGG